MKKNFTEIEIPFGVKDSELYQFTYTIPDGYSAEIKDGKVIVKKKESKDERLRKALIDEIKVWDEHYKLFKHVSKEKVLAYLEKQKDERKLVFIEGKMEGVRQTCQEIKDAMSLFEPKDLTPFEFTFRDYIDSAIRYCLAGEGYQQYIKEWAADLLNLEKQKEQKTLILDGEIEDSKRDIVAAIRKYYQADYAEYLTSFLKGLSPEDNSEDEYGQEMLGIAYKLMYEHIPENLRTQEFWDSLKFMREYTGKVAIIHSYEQQPAEQLGGTFTSYDMAKTFTEGQNYVVAHPEKFGLYKPVEWSEEDEDKVDDICKLIEHATIIPRSGDDDTGIPPTRLNDKYKGELKAFVKSLRNRPTKSDTWKPSEEQISALEYFIRSWGESGTMSPQNPTLCAAKTLLNDLKSL